MNATQSKFNFFPIFILFMLCLVHNSKLQSYALAVEATRQTVPSYEESSADLQSSKHSEHLTTSHVTHREKLTDRRFEFWEYRAGLLFQAYGGIVVIVLGFFGNILTLAVLITNYPMNSSTVYLIQLTVADLGAVCVGWLLRVYIRAWTGFESAGYHPWICKLWFFINHSFNTISGWTLVALSIERVLVVYLPFKAKTFCTMQRAKTVIAVIDVLCMGCYLHYFWTYGALYGPDNQLVAGCTIMKHKPELSFYTLEVRPWQDLAVRTGGPFFSLLICNCLIVAKLLQQLKRRKQMATVTDESKTKSMTKMLLTVSIAFLLLVAPMQIMYLFDQSDPYGQVITERWQAVASLRWGITILLYFLNHAINCILYCISGQEFRLALKKMLIKIVKNLPCKRKCSRGQASSIEGNSNSRIFTISSLKRSRDTSMQQSC